MIELILAFVFGLRTDFVLQSNIDFFLEDIISKKESVVLFEKSNTKQNDLEFWKQTNIINLKNKKQVEKKQTRQVKTKTLGNLVVSVRITDEMISPVLKSKKSKNYKVYQNKKRLIIPKNSKNITEKILNVQKGQLISQPIQKKLEKRKTSNVQSLDILEKSPTIVIFAPHPDDEILCCSERIKERLSEGYLVKIIYFTDGGAFSTDDHDKSKDYAQIRKEESKESTKKLGLTESSLYFLGFPDGLLADLEEEEAITSVFTGQDRSAEDTYFSGSLYTQRYLFANVWRIIHNFSEVEEIYFPSQEDNHPDHKMVGILGERMVDQLSLSQDSIKA